MITADSDTLLADVRGALKDGGVSQFGDLPGLPHLPEVETWLANGEVLLKVTVAPEERSGADAIPERVQDVLRSSGFALALAHDCATPAAAAPAAALGSGRAVRVITGTSLRPRLSPRAGRDGARPDHRTYRPAACRPFHERPRDGSVRAGRTLRAGRSRADARSAQPASGTRSRLEDVPAIGTVFAGGSASADRS